MAIAGGVRAGVHDDEPARALEAGDEATVAELIDRCTSAIDELPAGERTVLLLRDVEGRPAAETCAALGLGEAHQRALLQRARTAVLEALRAPTRGPCRSRKPR